MKDTATQWLDSLSLSSKQLLGSILLGLERWLTRHCLCQYQRVLKDCCYKAEAAESLPIRADMMLISPVLLGKLFSTFVSPVIYARQL